MTSHWDLISTFMMKIPQKKEEWVFNPTLILIWNSIFLHLEYKILCNYPPRRAHSLKYYPSMTSFALQSNKSIFFSSTQNSVSSFLFSTSGQWPSFSNTISALVYDLQIFKSTVLHLFRLTVRINSQRNPREEVKFSWLTSEKWLLGALKGLQLSQTSKEGCATKDQIKNLHLLQVHDNLFQRRGTNLSVVTLIILKVIADVSGSLTHFRDKYISVKVRLL